MIQILDDRSTTLNARAMWVLVLIVLLLVAAAVIFYLAPEITRSDFRTDLVAQQAELGATKQGIASTFQNANNYATRNKSSLDTILSKYGASPMAGLETPSIGSIFLDLAALTSKGQLQKRFESFPESSSNAEKRPVRIDVKIDKFTVAGGFAEGRVSHMFVDMDSMRKIADAIRSSDMQDMPSRDLAEFTAAYSMALKVGLVESALRTDGVKQELFHTGDQANEKAVQQTKGLSGEPLSAFIIQTTITRFGTVTLVVYLVSILSSLYRYNYRLAAFYTARADALRLAKEGVESIGFDRLMSALTPTFDFGKSPQTPIDQIIALMRELRTEHGSHKGADQ